jgi:hypothetical protein
VDSKKNFKELLKTLKSRGFSKIDSYKTYDLCTLYTTIPHSKLRMESCQIFSTTVQDAIIDHLLVLYLFHLVQTYNASTTKHYPQRKKFVNLNFERGT